MFQGREGTFNNHQVDECILFSQRRTQVMWRAHEMWFKSRMPESCNGQTKNWSVGPQTRLRGSRLYFVACPFSRSCPSEALDAFVHQSLTPQAPELHPLTPPLHSTLIWFLWLVTQFVWPFSSGVDVLTSKNGFLGPLLAVFLMIINWHLVYTSVSSKFQQWEIKTLGLIQQW